MIVFQLIAAAAAVVIDQIVKHWTVLNIAEGGTMELIPGIIHLTYVKNYGAALNMFSGMRWILLAVSVAFIVVGIWALIKKKITTPLGTWSVAAIIAGAAGNAIDRAVSGFVVDMFEFEIILDFFIFNVADVFITFGGIAFCIYIIIHEFKQPEKQNAAEVSDGKDNDSGR